MRIEKKTLRNVFLGIGACIVLYWLLLETASVSSFFSKLYSVFSPFLVGAGLAFVFNVPMRAIERILAKVKGEKLRRGLAVTITLTLAVLVLALVFYLLIPELAETIKGLGPRLKALVDAWESKVSAFLSDNPKLKEWVDNTGVVGKALEKFTQILSNTLGAITGITGTLMNVVVSLVFAIYCLCHKETLARQGRKILYALLPETFVDGTIRVLRLTNTTFSNFLSGQCIEVCILGVMFAITMTIFRMPYVVLVSVLIAITAFIPVVGAWAGCVCGTFLIFVANPAQAAIFLVIFVVLQQIENNIIYPRVVGTSIGLSGMWVLVAVAVGGELMGVAGMFIMIPVAAVIQTLLREYINKKLETKNIDPAKLAAQPPDVNEGFISRIKNSKKNKPVKKTENKQSDENTPE